MSFITSARKPLSALAVLSLSAACVPVKVDPRTGAFIVGDGKRNVPLLMSVNPTLTGTYGEGGLMNIVLAFNSEVEVTGAPRLVLTIGSQTRHADYLMGSGTYALVFQYVVQVGDQDANGIDLEGHIDLNGGALTGVQSGKSVSTKLKSADFSQVKVNTLLSRQVGAWTLDEVAPGTAPSGSDFQDSSPYGKHAMRVGSPAMGVGGHVGNAVEISSGTAIEVTNGSAFADGVATVSLWMRWDGSSRCGMPFGFARYDLYLCPTADHFGFNTGNGDIYGVSNVSSMANRWVHVVAEFHSGGLAQNKLFIDGVEQALVQGVSTPNVANAVLASTFRFGSWTNDLDFTFPGSLDEVQVWRRALSTDEIAAISQ